MASYSSRVRADAARWVTSGLIDGKVADAIVADVEGRERRLLSFGSILAIMAALLLGAAILIAVAANWETFPRLGRVGALFAIIFAGYVGGAVLKTRDHPAVAEAVWLIAAAAFGGSIALIGQMYHMSGDETQAILVWCAGTAVAAVALRSAPLTMAAVALAAGWLFFAGASFWRESPFPHAFLGVAAVLWAVSYWTESAAARHFLLLSLVFYGVMLAAETDVLAVALPMAALSAAVFGLAIWKPEETEKAVHIDGHLPVHGLIGFLAGITMTQVEISDSGVAFAVASAIGLAGIVTAVLLGGRQSRGLRWIGYAGFALQLCLIYGVMIVGMLGTASFFLAAGLLLGAAALAIIRIEKRLGDAGKREGAPA